MLRFLLLVVSVMAASTSTAGGVSQCPVDKVPIQITDGANRDLMAGVIRYPIVILSADEILPYPTPHFRTFVMTITEHIAVRLTKNKLCLDSAESKERSLLQFENWPLFTYGDKPHAPGSLLDARPSNGCRIFSPWIDLVIERKPVPWIRGIVRWNQRQLLADQAVLAGVQNVPLGVAMPLTSSEYVRFTYEEYVNSELNLMPAAKPIEERVPPDLLWLFRRSTQSTRGPFGGYVGAAMDNAIEKGVESYTKLVIALIDRCLVFNGTNLNYKSILDAADLIPLEQYKIDTPIH